MPTTDWSSGPIGPGWFILSAPAAVDYGGSSSGWRLSQAERQAMFKRPVSQHEHREAEPRPDRRRREAEIVAAILLLRR